MVSGFQGFTTNDLRINNLSVKGVVSHFSLNNLVTMEFMPGESALIIILSQTTFNLSWPNSCNQFAKRFLNVMYPLLQRISFLQ